MSKKQIDIALNMIRKAQSELHHEFNIDDFEALISFGLESKIASNKGAQDLILKMASKNKAGPKM